MWQPGEQGDREADVSRPYDAPSYRVTDGALRRPCASQLAQCPPLLFGRIHLLREGVYKPDGSVKEATPHACR
ncbi:hypothetical protein GCM10010361_63140 [Streptomyces olivaceiscleroticus]|uniref:Uncharacterized protein n=1 Tax=Streptomyces olivaceiscleroticus TaxID=68245 RepID=A0ABP3KY44_9ACTN